MLLTLARSDKLSLQITFQFYSLVSAFQSHTIPSSVISLDFICILIAVFLCLFGLSNDRVVGSGVGLG